MPIAQIKQAHTNTYKAHWFVAAHMSGAKQAAVTVQVAASARLLQSRLGKIVKLEFDERLVRTIAAVKSLQASLKLIQQGGQAHQTGTEIR